MRIDVDCSCFLETSTHLQETKLKIVCVNRCCLEWRETKHWERLSIRSQLRNCLFESRSIIISIIIYSCFACLLLLPSITNKLPIRMRPMTQGDNNLALLLGRKLALLYKKDVAAKNDNNNGYSYYIFPLLMKNNFIIMIIITIRTCYFHNQPDCPKIVTTCLLNSPLISQSIGAIAVLITACMDSSSELATG
jgi:hypothetical protein